MWSLSSRSQTRTERPAAPASGGGSTTPGPGAGPYATPRRMLPTPHPGEPAGPHASSPPRKWRRRPPATRGCLRRPHGDRVTRQQAGQRLVAHQRLVPVATARQLVPPVLGGVMRKNEPRHGAGPDESADRYDTVSPPAPGDRRQQGTRPRQTSTTARAYTRGRTAARAVGPPIPTHTDCS